MEHNNKFSAVDFFLYLGMVAALYVSVGSILALLFEYVDALFPDPLEGGYRSFSGSIRFAMSALIVAFPLLLVFTRITNTRARAEEAKLNLAVRKILLSLTLFIAGAVVAGDLMVLINTFLGGDLTLRFLSKVAVVLVVFSAVFAYYFKDLKGYWQKNEGSAKMVGWVAGVAILVAIVSGFFIIGSPWVQRDMRFDERRVSDLQNIQWQIVNYWQQKGAVPATLADLQDSISGFRAPKDPATGGAYGYRVLEAGVFELCATFTLTNEQTSNTVPWPAAPQPATKPGARESIDENWAHGAGEVCFERTIDPDLYPIRPMKQ